MLKRLQRIDKAEKYRYDDLKSRAIHEHKLEFRIRIM